jgi:TetR/AcrR family transcriptional regulator, cholesterol catabolism regulator
MNRHEAILHASTHLFHERGYAGTSMQDIADAVGIDKGNLYLHTCSKEDLLFEILERFSTLMLEKAAARAAAGNLTPHQQIEAILLDILAIIRDQRAYIDIFFHERHALHGPRWEAIERKRVAYEALVRDLIRRGQSDGVFRADLDARIVTLGFFGMVNWSLFWLDPNGRVGVDEIARVFTTLFLDGLRPRSDTV